ncbi:MAG: tRNA dihydrouridine synthase DusB [Candidatus Zixiibacteriota bacterium]
MPINSIREIDLWSIAPWVGFYYIVDMKIGNLILSGKVILAPLAGIADSPFRLLAKRFGAALVYTEMISAEGLTRDGPGSLRLLDFKPDERPIGVQIFGSDPERMASACRLINQSRPDLIDINCGCPVRKVVKKNGGAALLKDLKLLEKILSAVKRTSEVPVTVKIRSGWDQGSLVALEVARLAQECGISAITVHPRTQKDGFSRKANWSIIAEVKEAVDIPVIGSGDVFSPEDAKNMLDRTACDAVMIGRGSFGNPWIFSRTNTFLEREQLLPEPPLEKRINVCLQHVDLSVEKYGESTGVKRMRKHMVWYTRGMSRCKELRLKLFTIETLNEVRQAFCEYLAQIERKHKIV